MKRMSIILLSICMLTACFYVDEDELVIADEKTAEVASQFVRDYKEALVESINTQRFRPVEPYLIGNTSFYHSLRRYVEDISGPFVRKSILQFDVEEVYVDKAGDLYVDVHEKVAIKTRDEREEIERRVRFHVTEHKGKLRVVNIIVRETSEK